MKASISIYTLKHFWKKSLFIDLILIILFLLCLFLSYKSTDTNKHFDTSGFWLNLSASFLSIWITVRLIENLISKREKLKNARNVFIDNIKHPSDYITKFFPRLDERDLTYLKRELKWFEKKWGNHFYALILKDNEVDIARKLIGFNREILFDLEHLIIGLGIKFNDESEKETDVKKRLDRLQTTIEKTEQEIENLIMEVWKTDYPITL